MKRIKIISLICILSVCFFLSQCSHIAEDMGKIIGNYYEKNRAYPISGEYVCAELDTTLVFTENNNSIQYSNGGTEIFYINFGGGFVGESGDFFALYHWNQETDQIMLTFTRFPEPFDKEKEYLFTR